MSRWILKTAAVFTVFLFSWTCVQTHSVTVDEVKIAPTNGRAVIYETDGKMYELRNVRIEGDTLVGTSDYGKTASIPIKNVRSIEIRKTNFLVPILVAGAAAVVVIAVVNGSKKYPTGRTESGSCPFVYSFDGTRYVLDGEPYGGAICRAMERTEWGRLDHLAEIDGQYRLLLANELDESEHTDEISLIVVDHPAGAKIVPEVSGRIHALSHPVVPSAALDQRKGNILALVRSDGDRYWESEVEGRNPEKDEDLKDILVFEFPKPEGAKKAFFRIHAQTTLWGEGTARGFLELSGDRLPEWYAEVDRHGPAYSDLFRWYMTGGMFTAILSVETREGWKNRGLLYGGGPILAKEKVYPLDIADVSGGRLRIKLEPAAGYWRLNALSVDYGEDAAFEATEIHPCRAVDQDGRDVLDVLSATDGRFFEMPDPGRHAELTFFTPHRKPGLERTIILKASGYYEIHTNGAGGAGRPALVSRVLREPRYAVRWALERSLGRPSAGPARH
jgi:hypothetical protein